MTWKEYEIEVFENIKSGFPNAKCEFNTKLLGKYSKGHRQCDVIVKQVINGVEYTTLVDAKYYSEKIDVKAVEEFISMANDINADYGVLVSPKGYSELAYNRAENDPTPILLDILTLDELKQFQGDCAIPYSGDNGVILTPAFGWIIDASKREGMVASSYRKGFDFNTAFQEKEFIYFNFWDTKKDPLTKAELLVKQTELVSEFSQIFESNIETIIYNSKELTIRKTVIENYLAVEYSCAIEHDGFIFFGILISPENRESVNKTKLVQMIAGTLPIQIVHEDRE